MEIENINNVIPNQKKLNAENFRIRKVPLCREKRKYMKIILHAKAAAYKEPSGSLSVAYQLRLLRKKFYGDVPLYSYLQSE